MFKTWKINHNSRSNSLTDKFYIEQKRSNKRNSFQYIWNTLLMCLVSRKRNRQNVTEDSNLILYEMFSFDNFTTQTQFTSIFDNRFFSRNSFRARRISRQRFQQTRWVTNMIKTLTMYWQNITDSRNLLEETISNSQDTELFLQKRRVKLQLKQTRIRKLKLRNEKVALKNEQLRNNFHSISF